MTAVKHILTILILTISTASNTFCPQQSDKANCYFKEHRLYGKIKIVDSFPDIKVQVVTSFPDLKVKVVDSQPTKCGEWKFVDSFPDLKIQFVNSFPDIKIQYVQSFPGRTGSN